MPNLPTLTLPLSRGPYHSATQCPSPDSKPAAAVTTAGRSALVPMMMPVALRRQLANGAFLRRTMPLQLEVNAHWHSCGDRDCDGSRLGMMIIEDLISAPGR